MNPASLHPSSRACAVLPRVTRRLLSTAALAVFSAAFVTTSATAAVVIDWGGDYVTADTNFANQFNGGGSGPSGFGGFADGAFKQLSPVSGYTGGVFYGSVLELSNYSSAFPSSNTVIANGTTTDNIRLKSGNSTPTAFLLLWDAGTVSFDADSSVHTATDGYTQQSADSGRLVIRSDGNYYVSQQIVAAANPNNNVGNLTGLTWFNYDPTASPDVNGGSLVAASGLVVDGAINNITQVGLYFESSGAGANVLRMQAFQVDATVTVIPEPASYAMLAGVFGLIGCAVMRRRRR